MATEFRKELTDYLRPRLGGSVSQEVVNWLDAWGDRAGVPRDGAAAQASAPPPPASASPPAPVPAPAAPASAAGDDRFDALFRGLAGGNAKPEVVQAMARSFAEHAPAFGQDKSKARIAEFVAQIANETGGFTKFEENLNYRAERLTIVWPGRFPNLAAAQPFANNPEALANKVYARPKEGNTQPGDGWKYRGRGALQLTFRNNYRRFGQLTGLPLEEQPDLAADPATSVVIALEFFKAGNVNHYIDAGNFKAARGITNAGDPNFAKPVGLEEVARLRAKALALL